MKPVPVLATTAACLLWLTGCGSSDKLGALLHFSDNDSVAANAASAAPVPGPETTGSVAAGTQVAVVTPAAPEDPNDDLTLGKRQFRANNFGLAERYF